VGISGARPITDAIVAASLLALAVCALGTIASVILRFRRARGDERQQIKWFTFAIAILALSVILFPLLETLGIFVVGGEPVGFIVPFLGLLTVPLSIGVAILRYRLYDIERIISRTFSYAIVTAILGATFALLVLLPPVLVGGDSVPDYVIAVATLVVAALFRPVRRRVQDAVDHRFNRKRYDAEHTIEAFTARLREQVDIDALGAELEDVVGRTMQPSHVSLWVREGST
jgi:hypothetical protein